MQSVYAANNHQGSSTQEGRSDFSCHLRWYFAPMEGVTGYVYRTVHHLHFPGLDQYFAPFIVPNYTRKLKTREKEDIDPANNQGIVLVPQILSNRINETLWAVDELASRGYCDINLNLGCPVPTIAKKHKGAGLLQYTDELESYLDGVFAGMALSGRSGVHLSVKTRLGTNSTEEAAGLIRIYNQYPISELIVHARCGRDMYRGPVDLAAFVELARESRIPVVYNGNVFAAPLQPELAEVIEGSAGKVSGIMAGRGLIADPSLVRQLQGGTRVTVKELRAFHDELYAAYQGTLPGGAVIVNRMKEIWHYMGTLFPGGGKCLKAIRKASGSVQYEAAVRVLFDSCEIGGQYRGE